MTKIKKNPYKPLQIYLKNHKQLKNISSQQCKSMAKFFDLIFNLDPDAIEALKEFHRINKEYKHLNNLNDNDD